MTTAIGGIHASITGDSTGFKAAFATATAELQKSRAQMTAAAAAMNGGFATMGATLSKVSAGVGTVSTAVKGFLALKAVEFLRDMVVQALETAAKIEDLSKSLGITTDALQRLAYAGKQSGLSIDDLSSLMAKLNKVIAESGAGNNTILDKLGIAAKDSNGFRAAGDVLNDLADKYAAAGSAAERSRILVEAFGRGGNQAANLLANGAPGIKKLGDEADRLGLVLSEGAVKQGKEANDALTRLGSVGVATLQKFFLSLAPAITAAADGLTEVVVLLGRLIPLWNSLSGNIAQFSLSKIDDEIVKISGDIEKYQAQIASNPTPGGKGVFGAFTADSDKQVLQQMRDYLIKLEAQREIIERLQHPAAPAGDPLNLDTPKTDKLEEYIASLREEVQLAQADGEAHDVLAAMLRAEAIARDQNAKVSEPQRETIKAYIQLIREANAAQKQKNKDDQTALQITEELLTPQQVYNARIAELTKLLTLHKISQETYNAGLQKAKETLDESDESLKTQKELVSQLGDAFGQFAESVAQTGKIGKDAFAQLIQSIEQTIVKLYILKPLMDQLFGANGGSSGGGLFGSLIGSVFGAGGASSTGSTGIAAGAGSFATGGAFQIGGSGGIDSKVVSFRGTPGEYVNISHGEDRGPVGGNMVVNVINNSDAKTSTQEQTGADGTKQLTVMIDKATAAHIGRKGSHTHAALTRTFSNLRPTLAKRG